MAINGYVKQILSSPAFIFDEIITKLLANNIRSAKIELSRQSTELDVLLFQAIQSVLNDLEKEEGFLSRFLYNAFGFQFRKNKRREQLIYLGSQLKTQFMKVKMESFRTGRQLDRFSLSMLDLKRLKDGFLAKNIYLQDEATLNKSKFYMNEIEVYIQELEEIQLLLKNKHTKILDTKKSYMILLNKIPRHHELKEESRRSLLTISP